MDKFEFNPKDIFKNIQIFKNPKSGTEAREMLSRPLLQLQTWINETLLTNILSAAETKDLINKASFESGSADMNKSVYDTDDDGIVEKADYSESTKTVDTISESELPIQSKAVYAYQQDIELTHRKKLESNSINIDSKEGNWAVDITEIGHGTLPEVYMHVEQSEGDNFRIQRATKCNNSSVATRYAGSTYVRDQYKGQAWSQWTLQPLIVTGTSETPPDGLPDGTIYLWTE